MSSPRNTPHLPPLAVVPRAMVETDQAYIYRSWLKTYRKANKRWFKVCYRIKLAKKYKIQFCYGESLG